MTRARELTWIEKRGGRSPVWLMNSSLSRWPPWRGPPAGSPGPAGLWLNAGTGVEYMSLIGLNCVTAASEVGRRRETETDHRTGETLHRGESPHRSELCHPADTMCPLRDN